MRGGVNKPSQRRTHALFMSDFGYTCKLPSFPDGNGGGERVYVKGVKCSDGVFLYLSLSSLLFSLSLVRFLSLSLVL